MDPEGNEVVSTNGAEAKRCEKGLYGGATKVCATKVRYNFWQTACQIDIRGGKRERIIADMNVLGVLYTVGQPLSCDVLFCFFLLKVPVMSRAV